MAKKIKIASNQSLADVAIQTTGTLEGIVTVAMANGLSVTMDTAYGVDLEIPDYTGSREEIVRFLGGRSIIPATALSVQDEALIESDECELCKCFK